MKKLMTLSKKELAQKVKEYRAMFTASVKERESLEVKVADNERLEEVVKEQSAHRLTMVEENDLLRKLLALYMPEIHRYRRW